MFFRQFVHPTLYVNPHSPIPSSDLLRAIPSLVQICDPCLALKKKTIGNVLRNLGWKLKETQKVPKKVIAPSITSIIKDNDYVAEIFDKYNVNTFHEDVELPLNAA